MYSTKHKSSFIPNTVNIIITNLFVYKHAVFCCNGIRLDSLAALRREWK